MPIWRVRLAIIYRTKLATGLDLCTSLLQTFTTLAHGGRSSENLPRSLCHAVPRKQPGALKTSASQFTPQGGVVSQPPNPFGNFFDLQRVDKNSRISDHFGKRAYPRGQDRRSTRHCFQRRESEPFI